ncbi:hypothetical protein [Flavobacterium sp. N1719]|uniref:hypothetical protein n=1 Tax=Flavobacterium sp. N1719 TaxID=2885633 RepID=UPI002221C243|nr:hypothetical protein [Flavobacterium sp. N1719]
MKKFIQFLLLVSFLSVQAQNEYCKLPDDLQDYYRYGKSEELLELWQNYEAKCAEKTFGEFAKGEQILRYEYDNATADTRKEKQQQLLDYYFYSQKFFPEQSKNIVSKRAMLLAEDKDFSKEELFVILQEAMNKRKEQFEDPMALKLYFDTALELDNSDSKVAINIVEEYLKVKIKALQNAKLFPAKADEFENLIQYMSTHSKIKERVTCESLEKTIQNVIENKVNDFDLYLALTNEMYEKCSRSASFLTIALHTYKLKETAQSSFLFGMAKFKHESLERAEPYLIASVDTEENKSVKADRASNLAMIFLGYDPGKSAALLQKAMQADPKNPNYPLLMGEVYQASILFCDLKDKQADAAYYLASQAVLEAAKVDAKYTAAAQKKSIEYKAKMKTPSAKGKKNAVELGCWINKTVNW